MADWKGDISKMDRRRLIEAGLLGGVALAAGAPAHAAADNDIVGMDARSLAKAIRSKRLSCVEVMRAFLDQIQRLNPRFNAIVSLRDEADLLKEANERDAQLRRGDPIGPLHGFPHAVKDLAPLKGVRFTSGGSPLFSDRIAAADNLPTARLRSAGVVFVGKTNAPEFGLGSHTVNRVFGPTLNAYDPARSAGGSSGGAAVALALRMLPLADGSDYAGSLRNPAGWNNVCGLRPSYGRVPDPNGDPWLPSMGVVGPMARNVGDLALLLSVQAGYDARAPLSVPGDGREYAGDLGADFKGKRIGWLADFGGQVPTETAVLQACGAALARFRALGCSVEEARPAYDVEAAWQAFIKLRAWQQSFQFASAVRAPDKRALLNPQAEFELSLAERLTVFDISNASQVRKEWGAAFEQLFATYDFLIAPSAQLFPFDIGLRWPTEIAGTAMRTYHEWMKGVCLVTLAGAPSLAVPAGFSAEGLPIGLQIIAPLRRELACLQLGAAFESAAPVFENRLPPVLAHA